MLGEEGAGGLGGGYRLFKCRGREKMIPLYAHKQNL